MDSDQESIEEVIDFDLEDALEENPSNPDPTPVPYPSEPEPAPMAYPSVPEPAPMAYPSVPEPAPMAYPSVPEPAPMAYPSVAAEQYQSTPAVQYPSPPQYTEYNAGVYSAQPEVQPVHQVMYQYQAQPQPQLHVHQMPARTIMAQTRPSDGQMQCPQCCKTVVPTVTYKNGTYTWLICGGLTLLMLWPCCLIPFFVNDLKDEEHSCPACHTVLQVYKRM